MLVTKIDNWRQHVFVQQAVAHPFTDDGINFLGKRYIFCKLIKNCKRRKSYIWSNKIIIVYSVCVLTICSNLATLGLPFQTVHFFQIMFREVDIWQMAIQAFCPSHKLKNLKAYMHFVDLLERFLGRRTLKMTRKCQLPAIPMVYR